MPHLHPSYLMNGSSQVCEVVKHQDKEKNGLPLITDQKVEKGKDQLIELYQDRKKDIA